MSQEVYHRALRLAVQEGVAVDVTWAFREGTWYALDQHQAIVAWTFSYRDPEGGRRWQVEMRHRTLPGRFATAGEAQRSAQHHLDSIEQKPTPPDRSMRWSSTFGRKFRRTELNRNQLS